jgi:predicted PurR-regulated permease PerM
MSSPAARNAVILIAAVVGFAALYWLRAIIAPLALALFLLIMIDGLAGSVRKYARAIPAAASLPAAILLVTAAFIGAVWIVVHGMQGFISSLSQFHTRLAEITAEVASKFHLATAPSFDELLTRIDPQQFLGPLAEGAQGFLSQALFVLLYLGFLLAARASFRKKVISIFPDRVDRMGAQHVFDRVRQGVEQYVWVQTVLNAIIAVICWGMMVGVGLDNAAFWAFVIFISGYIPIIGGILAVLAPPLFALIQFHTYWQAGVLLLGIEAVNFVAGNIFLPRMQGKSMNIDPVVVLLSLAFWGALWGVAGAFLSTPLTVVVMAVLAEFEGSRWLAILLSGDGEPYPMEPPPAAVAKHTNETPPKPKRAGPKKAAR